MDQNNYNSPKEYNYKKHKVPEEKHHKNNQGDYLYQNNNNNNNYIQDYNNMNNYNYDNNYNINNNYNYDNQIKHTKSKNKIKIIIYKNGFILNDGPFRDKSIPENSKFMKEIENEGIPNEILQKENFNFEMLIEDRKNEVYSSKAINPITVALQECLQKNTNNKNNIDKNNKLNTNIEDLKKMGFNFDNIDLNSNIKINPPIILDSSQNIYDYSQFENISNVHNNNQNKVDTTHYQYQDTYLINQHQHNQQKQQRHHHHHDQNQYPQDNQHHIQKLPKERKKIDPNNMNYTPIESRKKNRKNILLENPKKNENENFEKKNRESLSIPKEKEEKKIHTFASLIKEEKEKEKEKEEKKNKKTNKKEEDKKEKKFVAFTGTGQIIGNINTEGLHVYKDVKHSIDTNSPLCSINIRLFNGEIVKSEFNFNQTLGDIYRYVYKISGTKNFHLLEGFPPKPLREYNKTIGELGLENTTLTQKIKE